MDLYIITVPSVVILAILALKKGFLTTRGTLSAIAVGVAVAIAHMGLFLLMAVFFVTSSLLTKLRAQWKLERGLKDVSGRSLRQVVGVGTPIAMFASIYLLTGNAKFLGAAAVAVAIATADTWASEVGVAYGGTPRYILAPWRRVEPGTSGGITLIGTMASVAGAFTIAALSPLLWIPQPFWKIALFGYLGELLDSILGAALQIKYVCNGKILETYVTGCRKKGFLTNESVNLVSGVMVGFLYVIT